MAALTSFSRNLSRKRIKVTRWRHRSSGLDEAHIARHTSRTLVTDARKPDLWAEYKRAKDIVTALELAPNMNPEAIFANNETSLAGVEVYGFDYDYTLATYNDSLHHLIYDLGREALTTVLKYPDEIRNLEYNPDFAIRGLHFDVHKGLFMKIDAFHNIQAGTVYRGMKALELEEIEELYEGIHVPVENMSSFHGRGQHMQQLMDLFALPEMTLLANVIEYYIQNNIPYDSEYVYYDVKTAVQGLHMSGTLHRHIMNDLEKYLGVRSGIAEVIRRLDNANKKLFLITNSPFAFVDRGMTYLLGRDWADHFDVIVVSARKPKFFNESSRPFRVYDRERGVRTFGRVTELKKGEIYLEGNLSDFRRLTNWFGSKVLYFGDHVYSDLADPNLKHGWRTGAMIPELAREIDVANTPAYKSSLRWLLALQDVIQRMQVHNDPESRAILNQWLQERDSLRILTKITFNPHFGSVFRTFHNPTYFSRRLSRFADIYTSSVENLLHYPLDYTFYPRRSALPHEIHHF